MTPANGSSGAEVVDGSGATLVVDASLAGGLGRSLVDGVDGSESVETGGSASLVQPAATSAAAAAVVLAKNSRRV